RHVFVASGEHYESRSHISRYLLDGTFDAEVGTKNVRSMLYTADGSLLTAGEDKLLRWPADGSAPTTVLSENTQQLWYAGNGELITTELLTSEFYRVSIATGVASSFKGVGSSDNVSGLAALKNGRWLFTSDDRLGLMSLDPQAPGAAKPALLFSLQGSLQAYRGYFQQIGRACLPTEVVDNQPAPEPPVPPERCDEVPAGAALLSEDFEQGAFSGTGTMRAYHGWTETTVYKPLTELDASEHVGGARSLRVSAKATNEQYEVSGVAHLFPNIKPSYIGYWVKGGGGGDHDDGAELRLQGTGHLDGVYLNGKGINTHESTVALAVDAGTWARIQLRDIDWTRRSYDLYVNCMRVADDIQFEPEAGDSLSRIDLFVGSRQSVPTDAFFDDLLIK
ncbi:MAG: hypothetical protein JWN48_6151, partial [Myxococcaceae bacterium]|nr:hypothetical protein [Myxococcaceae bacterium]